MTSIGTGVAAGVAQTAQQAQEVARRRDRKVSDENAAAKRITDLIEIHMRALEEGDEANSPSQLLIDGQLPHHQGPEQAIDGINDDRAENQRESSSQLDVVADADTPPGKPRLYRHLDIQA